MRSCHCDFEVIGVDRSGWLDGWFKGLLCRSSTRKKHESSRHPSKICFASFRTPNIPHLSILLFFTLLLVGVRNCIFPMKYLRLGKRISKLSQNFSAAPSRRPTYT